MSPALSPSELVVLTQGEADVILFNEYSASDTTDFDKLFHSSDFCDSGDEPLSPSANLPTILVAVNFSLVLVIAIPSISYLFYESCPRLFTVTW